MTGKTAKILFLQNQSSKILPTCSDLSIGGRAKPGNNNIDKFPEIRYLQRVLVER